MHLNICLSQRRTYIPGKYNQAGGMAHYIKGWYIDGSWYIKIKYGLVYVK